MKAGKLISYIIYICIISALTLLAFAYLSPSFKDATIKLIFATKNRLAIHSDNFTAFFAETFGNSGKRDRRPQQDKATTKVTFKKPQLEPDNLISRSFKTSKTETININVERKSQTIAIRDGVSGETGFIYITSTPESAMVMIDSSFVGKAPLTVKVNQAGTYRVSVKHKYYNTWQEIIRVKPSEVTRVEAMLTPGKGLLTVISRPQEAGIYLDEKPKGRTPLTIKSLPAGIHQIYLAKNDLEYFGEVEILTGKDEILDVELKKLKNSLIIDSNPSGAEVYIDGIQQGTTPVTIEDVRIGKHQLILVKGDSLAYVDTLNLDSEKDSHHFTLKNKDHFQNFFSSTIRVDSEANNAFVYLNKAFRGAVPLELNHLRTGEHEILVVKSASNGSHFFKSKLFLTPNETKEIYVKKNDYRFEKN